MNTITVDCGASFIKAALVSDTGEILRIIHKKAPDVCDDNYLVPNRINALTAIVDDVVCDLSSGTDDIKVCISNEMHGFMLAYENGEAYTDYISWKKEYGTLEVHGKRAIDVLKQTEFEEDIKNSGMPARGGLPSSNLLYMHMKDELSKNGRRLYFYTLGDYLIKRIFGVDICIHPTNAAATGLYNVKADEWNDRLIEVCCGCDNEIIFQEIGCEPFNKLWNGKNVYVYPSIGDQQAALLGAGMKDGAISYNLGTGAQVSILSDTPELSDKYQTRPFFKGKYLKTIPHIPSGRALNVYFNFIKDVLKTFGVEKDDGEIWEKILERCEETEDSNLKIDLSFFENAVTDRIVGYIDNIDENNLRFTELIVSVVKQMSKNFYAKSCDLIDNSEDVGSVVFSGGIARKIAYIRDSIVKNYSKDCEIAVSENETMNGLFLYGNSKP